MFTLPNLPYDLKALEPYISAKTLEFHYGKHHAAYVTNLNDLIKGTDFENKTLEEIIKATAGDTTKIKIFNNAAQAWNHEFYWQCLKPGGTTISEEMKKNIVNNYGSYEQFKEDFKNAVLTQFGSGWVWLVSEAGKIKIEKTSNAETPITHKKKPLLTIDVWEHAYYLDYQNRRGDYFNTLFDRLLNWNFAQEQYRK
ncbi:MAG: superoxide dismutase [Planctomycetes bacterium]|jgi:Fe-Mn family superoxide dismutase|nr:superoxide dismutase [Planctomycetota bacterium]